MSEINSKFDKALNTKFWAWDIDKNITLRAYLAKLLTVLVQEGEGFSGKRPFGNSGWEAFAAVPLIKADLIDGQVAKDGRHEVAEVYDEAHMAQVMPALIAYAMGVTP